jgi:hypothetical protein
MIKHCVLPAVFGVAVLAASATPALAQSAGMAVFRCSLGARQVEVVRDGNGATYRFGRAGRPELTINGSAAARNLFAWHELFPHAERRYLRFTQGSYNYVVRTFFRTPDYSQQGAADDRELLVIRNGRLTSRMRCRSGGEFQNPEWLDSLPQDTRDMTEGA